METNEIKKIKDHFYEKIKDGYMVEWALVSEMANEIELCEDEQDEVLDFLHKQFNFLNLQNGDSYFVDKSKKGIKEFLSAVEISDDDYVWYSTIEDEIGQRYELVYSCLH